MGKKVVVFSIDDFYKTFEEREQLQETYPCLGFRGPPGTHNTEKLLAVINQFKSKDISTVQIPIFDKSLHNGQGDRVSQVQEVSSEQDIVILEGWFVGLTTEHLTDQDLQEISTSVLAKFSYENLKKFNNFDFLDSLIVLKPEKFEYSITWRKEQEKNDNGNGMSEGDVEDFVEYFFESLNPQIYYRDIENRCDLLLKLDENREVLFMEECNGKRKF